MSQFVARENDLNIKVCSITRAPTGLSVWFGDGFLMYMLLCFLYLDISV